mmetsp:Transcript_26211/g.26456  ORF Transcript_26211/g.26456 Transcript_26211/m.26456 type:complete len:286 (-) Transcript_26211:58-915(-)
MWISAIICEIWITLLLIYTHKNHAFHCRVNQRRDAVVIAMVDNKAAANEKSKGMKGYYVRPSKAIEKGGGFYIPGLEDERLRITAIAGLMVMFAVNRAGYQEESAQLFLSELTGVSMAVFLLLQSISSFDADKSSSVTSQYLSILQSDESSKYNIKVLETTVRSILRTSESVNYIAVLSDNHCLVELGPIGRKILTNNTTTNIQNILSNKFSNKNHTELYNDIYIMPYNTLFLTNSYSLKDESETPSIIGVIKDPYHHIWLIGGNSEESLINNKKWILDLIKVPY